MGAIEWKFPNNSNVSARHHRTNIKLIIDRNHRYESPGQALYPKKHPKGRGIQPSANCFGIVPNPDLLGLDSSSNKFQCAYSDHLGYVLLKFGTHYDLQISVRITPEI